METCSTWMSRDMAMIAAGSGRQRSIDIGWIAEVFGLHVRLHDADFAIDFDDLAKQRKVEREQTFGRSRAELYIRLALGELRKLSPIVEPWRAVFLDHELCRLLRIFQCPAMCVDRTLEESHNQVLVGGEEVFPAVDRAGGLREPEVLRVQGVDLNAASPEHDALIGFVPAISIDLTANERGGIGGRWHDVDLLGLQPRLRHHVQNEWPP